MCLAGKRVTVESCRQERCAGIVRAAGSKWEHMKKLLLGLAACLMVAGLLSAQPTSAQRSRLPRRAFAPMVASDPPTPEPAPAMPAPPPPGPGYCGASALGPPSPPNTIFGKFTIGGEDLPALTLVTLTFDGQPGPSAYTAKAGGYAIQYNAGGQGHTPPCINQVGTEMGILVNGQLIDSGVKVGDNIAYLIYRFDIALP